MSLEHSDTPLPGVILLQPKVYRDPRGRFQEYWSERLYREAGIVDSFVQDNISVSKQGVLRGIHVQPRKPQGKLIGVAAGRVLDVAVDLRRSAPTYGRYYSVELSNDVGNQLYIPPGMGHGFVVLSREATVVYKCTDYYDPGGEVSIRWDDPGLAIDWPCGAPILSRKDAEAISFEAYKTWQVQNPQVSGRLQED